MKSKPQLPSAAPTDITHRHADYFVSLADLRPDYGLPFSRAHIYKLIASGDFPKPFRLSPGRVGYTHGQIIALVRKRSTARKK